MRCNASRNPQNVTMPAMIHWRGANPGPCHAYQTERITSPSDQLTSTKPALFRRTLTSQMTNIIKARTAAPTPASWKAVTMISSANLQCDWRFRLRVGKLAGWGNAAKQALQNLVDQVNRYRREERPHRNSVHRRHPQRFDCLPEASMEHGQYLRQRE